MGYCKYCGKELDSEGRCTCAEFEDEHSVKKEKIKADALTDGKAKKILIGIGIAAILIVLCIIAGLIVSSLNAYKKPISKLAKGISKADTEMLMDVMYTEEGISEKKVRAKDNGLEWDEYMKQKDKMIKNLNESAGLKRVNAKVVAKEKLSGSNFDEIQNYYSKEFNADVKKAYRVEVNFNTKEIDGKAEYDGWFCVVKLKDGGWKYCPKFSPDQYQNELNFVERTIAAVEK